MYSTSVILSSGPLTLLNKKKFLRYARVPLILSKHFRLEDQKNRTTIARGPLEKSRTGFPQLVSYKLTYKPPGKHPHRLLLVK